MKILKSCELNLDADCVELVHTNGIMLSIDTSAANMYQCSEPEWLIGSDLKAYADLALNSDAEGYLKRVTEYRPE